MFNEIPYYLDDVLNESIWPGVIDEGSKWCFVKKEDVKTSLRNSYKNQRKYKRKANILKKIILEDFDESSKLNELANQVLFQNNKGEKK